MGARLFTGGMGRAGKTFSIFVDFIDRIKRGESSLIHGPEYVVMDRKTFDLMSAAYNPVAKEPKS